MADRAPDLRTLQTLFWRLVSAPEGAAQGAAELQRERALETGDLSFLVRAHARMSATEQVDVYADMYFYRLRDALAEDYPAVAAQLGGAGFHNLITDYLLAHPPTHFSLRELGRALPGFVAAQGDARLADLAALEWARVDVFDAADDRPLTREALLEEGEAARLVLVRAARLLHVDASVLPLWRQRMGGVEPPPEPGAPGPASAVRVWRKGFGVYHRSMAADEAACIAALAGVGATLAELGERVAAHHPQDAAESAGERLAGLLALWLEDQILKAG